MDRCRIDKTNKNDSQRTTLVSVVAILRLCGILLFVKVASGVLNSLARASLPIILKDDFGFSEKGLGTSMSASYLFGGFANGVLLEPLTRVMGGSLATVIRNCLFVMGVLYAVEVLVYTSVGSIVVQELGVPLWTPFAILGVALSMLQFTLSTASTTVTSTIVPSNLKGTMLGIEHALFSLARIFGPPAGMYLLKTHGLVGVAGSCACGFVTLWSQHITIRTLFYSIASLLCALEIGGILLQMLNVQVAMFFHDLAAFCYILCFSLVLTHWILLQIPISDKKLRRRVYYIALVIPNIASLALRVVIFVVKITDTEEASEKCTVGKIEALLYTSLNFFLLASTAKVGQGIYHVLHDTHRTRDFVRGLSELIGTFLLCILCNAARCLIAISHAWRWFGYGGTSICCSGQMILYNVWLEELIPLLLLIKVLWTVQSSSTTTSRTHRMERRDTAIAEVIRDIIFPHPDATFEESLNVPMLSDERCNDDEEVASDASPCTVLIGGEASSKSRDAKSTAAILSEESTAGRNKCFCGDPWTYRALTASAPYACIAVECKSRYNTIQRQSDAARYAVVVRRIVASLKDDATYVVQELNISDAPSSAEKRTPQIRRAMSASTASIIVSTEVSGRNADDSDDCASFGSSSPAGSPLTQSHRAATSSFLPKYAASIATPFKRIMGLGHRRAHPNDDDEDYYDDYGDSDVGAGNSTRRPEDEAEEAVCCHRTEATIPTGTQRARVNFAVVLRIPLQNGHDDPALVVTEADAIFKFSVYRIESDVGTIVGLNQLKTSNLVGTFQCTWSSLAAKRHVRGTLSSGLESATATRKTPIKALAFAEKYSASDQNEENEDISGESNSESDRSNEDEQFIREIEIDLLAIANLPQDESKRDTHSATDDATILSDPSKLEPANDNIFSSSADERTFVRVFRFQSSEDDNAAASRQESEKPAHRLVVTEVLEEVTSAFEIPIRMLRYLVTDLGTSLRTCERKYRLSVAADREKDRRIRAHKEGKKMNTQDLAGAKLGHGGSMEQLLYNLHEEVTNEDEIKRHKQRIARRKRQISSARDCLRHCETLAEKGISFKSSREKKASSLRFVSTNLHLQRMLVFDDHEMCDRRITSIDEATAAASKCDDNRCRSLVADVDLDDLFRSASASYATVTVGAAADHVGGFKYGGIYQMNALKKSKREHLARADDADDRSRIEWKIERLDMALDFRKEVVVSQLAPALVAAFASQIDRAIMDAEHSSRRKSSACFFHQLESIGFLIAFESLLSSHGKEAGMLGDHFAATGEMERFSFVIRPSNRKHGDRSRYLGVRGVEVVSDSSSESSKIRETRRYEWEIAPRRFLIVLNVCFGSHETCLPKRWTGAWSDDRDMRPIRVTPALLSRGINEWAFYAQKFEPHHVATQTNINAKGVEALRGYCDAYLKLFPSDRSIVEKMLKRVQESVTSAERTVPMLETYERLSRFLRAGRVTSCKSAKDRTAMCVTWEQARILRANHALCRDMQTPSDSKKKEASARVVMRTHGVRIANAKKNTGKAKYCFNSLQRRFFPEELKNPDGTGGGGMT
eukprot:g732.t1